MGGEERDFIKIQTFHQGIQKEKPRKNVKTKTILALAPRAGSLYHGRSPRARASTEAIEEWG